ncbi:MAG: HD domain-containing protein [Anaerolineales bacterium]|nr:HD domain-containing protein [Anaerolineales bacterium]
MFRDMLDSSQQDIKEHIFLAAHIAELKEWDNRAHLERVRRYVYLFSTGMGISEKEAKLFSIAAQLHDIGKIMIPDSIQKKTDNLEPHEWEISEQHTVEGARLLRGSSSVFLQAGEIIALTHHERWDGSGYPKGIKGSEIPMTGRITALADVFDALTTKRPYKKEITPEEAANLVGNSAGTLFDPDLVKVFQQSFDEVLSIHKAVR